MDHQGEVEKGEEYAPHTGNLHHAKGATNILGKRFITTGLDIALIHEPWINRGYIRGLTTQVEERRPGMTDKSGGGCVRRPMITETSDDDDDSSMPQDDLFYRLQITDFISFIVVGVK
ncbi:hypothetical protein J6590_083487 [Homalodisca vitripennis]|nr:hypothetical protein J6590_083487 [Homalodisca vitripennis]